MPTLWVLGGSFAVPYPSASNYIHILSRGLGLEISSYSMGGSSIPHMCMEQWPQIRDHIGCGDVVLVALTAPHRTYFLSGHPTISALSDLHNHTTIMSSDDIPTEEKSTLINYYTYLHRDPLNLSWLRSWFYELNHVCIERGVVAIVLDGAHHSDLHTIDDDWSVVRSIWHMVTSTFKNKLDSFDTDRYGNTGDVDSSACQSIIRGHGHLYGVSREEHVDRASCIWLEEHGDFRMNHLGIVNHKVLADKITASIKDGAMLDLTTGFHTRYIDKQYFKSVGWLQQHTMWPPFCDIEGVWP